MESSENKKDFEGLKNMIITLKTKTKAADC